MVPLRAGDKRCDRLFPCSQFNRAIAPLFRFPSILSGARGVRPYVQATNSAIACSIRVNSTVRSLPCSYFRQFDRAQVGNWCQLCQGCAYIIAEHSLFSQ
ncbi:MAG: hypothetical protein RIM23_31085 [Coleofasciculus sp. G3-WIS-01]|uniref:hypothetical protein n=1 Tax=Coleofasciculus sp. G3-WIS-01 TaxID=3069528 RepID=UPI0032F92E6B